MKLVLALTFISSLAMAEDAAQMAALSAQCNRVQIEANADVGRKLVLECQSKTNKCEACCHAAVAAYLQAVENQKTALQADKSAQSMSLNYSSDQAAIARAQSRIDELRTILEQANLKIDMYYAKYTPNSQESKRISELTEEVNKLYTDNFAQCRAAKRAVVQNNRKNTEAVTVNAPKELSVEERRQLTAQRVREIRAGVQLNYESLSRSFVDDRIGIRQADIFRMMSNQYRAQVQRGNLK